MAEEIKEKPARKKFQMPNTYVILFAVIAFIALLTWLVPGGAYELSEGGDAIAGTYHVVESSPQGLWDIFMAPSPACSAVARSPAPFRSPSPSCCSAAYSR